jgi:phosphoribosylformimino-5-aminoimidazole carboxamide ribonucleotide (ProFAR) isomerase
VTASGGVSSLSDLRKLKSIRRCGVDSVIVGKALYEGRFTLQEALLAA